MSSTAHGEPATARLWEDALADEVIAARAERGMKSDPAHPIVCASGISPSGPIHLGNLREVFTTHLVAEALRRRGEDVVHLHSWDDYDRFRKVPAGVDTSFERYIGRPLASIPDPTRPHGEGSYAEHFMDELRASLHVLGIRMTERRQSELYPAGTYNRGIRKAMDQRLHVFDVLAGQQIAGGHASVPGAHAIDAECPAARPPRRASRPVNHRQLAVLDVRRAGSHAPHRLLGVLAARQGIEQRRAQPGVGHVLRSGHSDRRPDMRAARGDRRARGGDHHPQLVGGRIGGKQRERHSPGSGMTAVASISTSHSGLARALTTRPVETGYTPLSHRPITR